VSVTITVTVICDGNPDGKHARGCALEYSVTKPWNDWPVSVDAMVCEVTEEAATADWGGAAIGLTPDLYDFCAACVDELGDFDAGA
jgi:hypothetical protein